MKVKHVVGDAETFEKTLNYTLKQLRGDGTLPIEIIKEIQYLSSYSDVLKTILYSALIIIYEA